MPSSSLGSLSPLGSPSPSPPPLNATNNNIRTSQATADAPLDTDGSELSELSDDDKEVLSDSAQVKIPTRNAAIVRTARNNSSTNTTRPTRTRNRKSRSGIIPPQMWDWAIKKDTADREEEEEDTSRSPKAMGDEEGDDDDDDAGGDDSVPTQPPRRRAAAAAANAALSAAVDAPRLGLSDDEYDDDDVPASTSGPVRGSRPHADDASDDEDGEYAFGDEITVGALGAESDGTDDEEDEDDGEMDEDPPPVTVPAATIPTDALMEVALDLTAPSPSTVAPVAAAAAASSIMAGSEVVEAPSPSSSVTSSPSSSPASSRSPSPSAARIKSVPRSPGKPVSKITAAIDKADTSMASSTGLLSPKKGTATASGVPVGDPEDADVEVDDEPDVDADLLESDLQPAHRAEALDVLAVIELKFALLRERLYVEKMEDLAIEEKWVEEGNHPELIYIHKELQERRDRCLDLANRKRTYEVETFIKRREVEEHAVWSTWKFQRDQLQTDMIAETSRKRRRLEREQRALQKPIPVRRIPKPPTEVPTAPTLREIVKAYPFAPTVTLENSRSRQSSKRQAAVSANSYPELSSLPLADVQHDMEFLYHHRRTLDHHRQVQADIANGLLGPAPGLPPQRAFELGLNGVLMNGTGPRHGVPLPHELGMIDPRQQPPPLGHPGFAIPPNMHQPTGVYAPGPPPPGPPPPPGRVVHPHPGHQRPPPTGPPGPPGIGMHSMHPGQTLEMEAGMIPQHSGVPLPPHIFGPHPGHGPPQGLRRTPSPQSQVGHAMHPPNGWAEDPIRRAEADAARRRDREREVERKRDGRERDAERRGREREQRHLDMSQTQQQHAQAPRHHHHVLPSQSNMHGPSNAHPPPAHHHHHHHHHVVHHHPPSGPSQSGLPPLRHSEGPPHMDLGVHGTQRMPTREYDGRPGTRETEVIHLAPVERVPGGHMNKPPAPYWGREEPQGPPSGEYARERDRDWERHRERERERARPSSRHSLHEERLVTPFVLPPSTQTLQMGGGPPPSSLFGGGHSRRESFGQDEIGRPGSAPTPPGARPPSNPHLIGDRGKMHPPSGHARHTSAGGTPLLPSPQRGNRPLPPLSPSMAGAGLLGSPSRTSLPPFVGGHMSPGSGNGGGKGGHGSPALPPLSGPGLAPIPRRPSTSDIPLMDGVAQQQRMMSPGGVGLGPGARLLEPLGPDRHSPRMPPLGGSSASGPPPPPLTVPPQAQKMSVA